MSTPLYTTARAAEYLATTPDRVIDLIHAGLIVAIDIRSPGARRATWRISQEAIDDFLRRRSSQPQQPQQRPRRQRRPAYEPTFY